MSFPEYQHYRRSGATWISNLPTNWRIAALKWVARRYAGGTPDKTKADYWTDGTIPWLNSGAVNQRLITEASEYITEEAYSHSSARWVPEGALVMALAGQGKTKGMVAQLAFSATCNQSMAAIVPLGDINSRYLFWWLDAQYQNIRNLAGGDLRDGLNLELLGQIPCPIPTFDEQLSIASFLDRETAKIDALVAEQERLIELLDEKRQAAISHAVTKGLNSKIETKDSGVRWLGIVPVHWKVERMKFLCSIQTGSRDTQDALPDGLFPFFVRSQQVERINTKAFDCEAIFTAGDGVGVGKVFHYHNGPFDFHQRVYMFSNFRRITGKFFFEYLRSNFFKVALEGAAKSTVDSLRRPMLANFEICVPPINEQIEISDHVEAITKHFEKLTKVTEKAVELLLERRSALISAAVTGKIDVRKLEAA